MSTTASALSSHFHLPVHPLSCLFIVRRSRSSMLQLKHRLVGGTFHFPPTPLLKIWTSTLKHSYFTYSRVSLAHQSRDSIIRTIQCIWMDICIINLFCHFLTFQQLYFFLLVDCVSSFQLDFHFEIWQHQYND